jgi:hypothetical protein
MAQSTPALAALKKVAREREIPKSEAYRELQRKK